MGTKQPGRKMVCRIVYNQIFLQARHSACVSPGIRKHVLPVPFPGRVIWNVNPGRKPGGCNNKRAIPDPHRPGSAGTCCPCPLPGGPYGMSTRAANLAVGTTRAPSRIRITRDPQERLPVPFPGRAIRQSQPGPQAWPVATTSAPSRIRIIRDPQERRPVPLPGGPYGKVNPGRKPGRLRLRTQSP